MATIETIRRLRVQTLAEGGDAARRDLMATAEAQTKLAQASGASAVVIDLAARKQLSANAAFEKTRIQVDALYAAQVRYERQVQALNRGLEQGDKTLEDYNSALELAKMKYDAAVASATKYQATLKAEAQAAIAAAKAQEQAAASYQNALNARMGVGRSSGTDRGADIEAAFAGADRLRAKYDDLFAASQRYETSRAEITGANRAGIITDDVAAASIQKVTQAYRDQVSVLENVNRVNKEAAQRSVNQQLIVPNRGADVAAYASELDKMQAEFDPAFAALQRYNAYLDRLDNAQRVGAISMDVLTARLTEATAAYDAEMGKINGVVAATTRLTDAQERALNIEGKLRAIRMVSGQMTPARDRGADIEAYGGEMDRRRAQYDQVFAAGQQYRAGLAQLREDLSVGAISEGLYTTELARRKAAFAEQINTLGQYSRAQRDAARAAQESAAAEQDAADKLRAARMVSAQTVPARDRRADAEAAFADADKQRAAVLPRVAAEQELASALSRANDMRKVGTLTETEYTGVIERANARFHDQTTELDKAEKAHKRLANGAGLSAYAYQNLGFQVNDVVTSLASGISPMQTFAQQGGQILQVLQMGEGGISGALKGIATTSVGFVAGLGAATLTISGFATAVILGGVAAYDFSSKTTELNRQLLGVGRASGTTVASINAMAEASAGAAGVSEREFRSMAGTFAATGEIGDKMYVGLIKSAKDFSRVSGQDLKTVTAELAAAFAAPAAGAESLNNKYNILNFTQLELIRRMDAQGNKLGAQTVLQKAYDDSIDKSGQTISGWGRMSGAVADYVSDRWTRAGALIDKAINGGTLEDQLAYAQRGLEQAKEARAESYDPLSFLFGGNDTKKYEAQIQKISDLIKSRDAAIKQGQTNKDGVSAGETLKGLSPAVASIQAIEDKATDLESKMGAITLDKQGEARRAIDYLRMQAKAMREDLEKGGAGLADSLRNAQFNNKMVGATGFGLDAAGINKKYDDETTDAFRKAGTNVASDEFNNTLQSIDQRRQLDLDTLEKTTVQAANRIGGAFSRMSTEVQAQILKGSARFPRVPPALIAALAKGESGGDLDVGYTKILDENGKKGTAYGLGQVTRTTGNEIQQKYGIDRMNRSTMGEAIAAVVETKLDAVGGDLDKAIMAYRGSRDPAVNRAYLAEVKKRMGEAGDISVGAQANVQEAGTQAMKAQQEELKRNTELYGVNTEKLNSQSAAQAEYTRLLNAGMPANEEFRKSLLGIAAAAEAAARDTKLVQFQRDTDFARDQLGRTDEQQQAYATARSMYGDVNDNRAKKVIDEVTKTQGMLETKNLIRDGANGFISELRRTGDAAGALANVFGNIADKMISKVLDSLVSSAFSGASGGGGFLASLFADGGIMTSSGKMPLRSYSSGGIANSPQLSLFGEGRLPEAYVPLPDGKRIPVAMSQPANSNGGGSTSTSVSYRPTYNFPQQIDGLTPQQASAMIDRKQQDFAKNLPNLVQEANRRRA